MKEFNLINVLQLTLIAAALGVGGSSHVNAASLVSKQTATAQPNEQEKLCDSLEEAVRAMLEAVNRCYHHAYDNGHGRGSPEIDACNALYEAYLEWEARWDDAEDGLFCSAVPDSDATVTTE